MVLWSTAGAFADDDHRELSAPAVSALLLQQPSIDANLLQSLARSIDALAEQLVRLTNAMNQLQGSARPDPREMQRLMTEFQAVTQQYAILVTAFNAALTRLGEGSAKLAPKN